MSLHLLLHGHHQEQLVRLHMCQQVQPAGVLLRVQLLPHLQQLYRQQHSHNSSLRGPHLLQQRQPNCRWRLQQRSHSLSTPACIVLRRHPCCATSPMWVQLP